MEVTKNRGLTHNWKEWIWKPQVDRKDLVQAQQTGIAMNETHIAIIVIIMWLAVTSDYDCIVAMLIESSTNGRLEMTNYQYLPLLNLSV